MNNIKVIVNGAKGKMGQECVKAIQNATDMSLVAQLDQNDHLAEHIIKTQADVVVDFTHPSCIQANIQTMIAQKCRGVIGTTGLSEDDLDHIRKQCKDAQVGIAICPNFAIGAILMMQFASQAAQYLNDVEIIETHHNQKADAPSGTAIKTAQMIAEKAPNVNPKQAPLDDEKIGSRGHVVNGIPIHAVRLPGFVANQEVILGSQGQSLHIKHHTIDRTCFMPGVLLAIRHIQKETRLVYGLENFL